LPETTQPVLAREPIRQGDSTSSLEASVGVSLPTPTFLPRRYKPRNVGEWTGHLTFASDLIVALQPQLIVELGTHWGEAYFTFCQTVQEHGLSSLCYAVDHWQGDEHAGLYGEEVYEEVSDYNARFYRQFSYLLRRSFDEALAQFSDNSVGLLHIDGLHTYEAVRHDFQQWFPKVCPGGIVLLHDIVPRHQDFGVWRLWDEIKSEFPQTFEFHHSWGLGVVRKGGARRGTVLEQLLFESSPEVQEDVRRHYVVYASHLEHVLGRMPAIPAPQARVVSEVRVKVFPRIGGTYTEENSQVKKIGAGEWHTVVFDLRDPSLHGELRIDPGSHPAFVEVGDIAIQSGESGELLWSSPASNGPRDFQVGGSALRHPNNPSFLVNVGENPNIMLNTPELRGPVRLAVTLKVTPVDATIMEMVRSYLHAPLADAVRRLDDAEREKSALAAELANTRLQLTEATDANLAAQAEVRQVRQLLVDMQHSASWVLTSPLRKIKAALGSTKP
jgi:hypothetical protein